VLLWDRRASGQSGGVHCDKETGKSAKYRLRCGTTTAELLRLADWLHGHQVTYLALEARGVYWKPVWHILEGQFELLLANPTKVQALRGRKTDLKDGERISNLCSTSCCMAVWCSLSPSSSHGI
jgi:hypothetical protein